MSMRHMKEKVGKIIIQLAIILYNCTGTIARDQAKNEGIEDLHSTEEGRNESRILLERYDLVS